MEPCVCILEALGMFVYTGAWLCALACTLMPQWQTQSTALLAIESYERGLWETCVVQEVGGTECRAYDTLLGLTHDIKLARIFMCLSLSMGVLGLLLAIPGLSLIKSCKGQGGRRAKRAFKVAGGVLGVVSGLLCLVPVSYEAHLTVLHFFDETVPDVVPRWEFGDALFCGWAGGFLLLVAGLLLVSSSLCCQTEPLPSAVLRRYEVQAADPSPKKRSEYV
ncbi:putative claudin-24 [Osmerus eperlanus]|uniref:putative claudin-24 n=1 Tax=Osmerus eperlanus TaxID=29151 RepID=UPI002E10161D